MRVLLIDHYAGSVYHGMEFRPYYMAREWVKAGNEVVIAAADFSHLRRVNPQVTQNFTKEVIDGITYLWVKTPKYHGNGIMRAVNIAAFYHKMKTHAKALAREYRPEAVIASSTYPFDIYIAAKIAKYSGGRFYFEIHDLWPLTQIELYGLKTSNPYVKMLQKAEDYAFKNAHKVISVLPQAYLHMEERGFSRDKFVYIPNGILQNTILVQNAETPATGEAEHKISELKSKGKFIVIYLGGFATANALDDFVDAAPKVNDNVMLVLIGDGVKKQELTERASGYKNILFLDSVKKEKVQGLLQLSDCLYLGAKRCSLYRYGIGMNKLYDYMLAAKPIICGIDASNDVVADSGCGVTIPPQNPQAIANAIQTMIAMSESERREMGGRGRDYVLKNHDYTVLAQKFLDALR